MKLFIIPGAGENTDMKPYKDLANHARSIGLKVVPINPEWGEPITKQIFKTDREDLVFGFSRGALLAYATTKKYPCKLAILASMTPLEKFSRKVLLDFYGKKIGEDILKIKFTSNKTPQITLSGGREDIDADIRIPNTGHRLTKTYLKQIKALLDSVAAKQ